MIDPIGTFNSVRGLIKTALCELESLKNIYEIANDQFPIYEGTLFSLQDSINKLHEVYKYGVPIEHQLEFTLLKLLELKLQKFKNSLDLFKKWNDNVIKPKCMSFQQFIYFITNSSPSAIQKKIESAFAEIEPLVEKQIKIERDIFGSAISIQHPILQKAWLMVGRNQLGDSFIPASMLHQKLFIMLKREENNVLMDPEFCMKKIVEFVALIDGLAGTKPDDIITISEINEFKATEKNVLSVKDLIGIDSVVKADKEKSVDFLDIFIDFPAPVSVDYSGFRTITEPLCVGYGADFNNIKACEFMVKKSLDVIEDYKLAGIEVECEARDQGYGGTNQSHLRYQVNDAVTVKALQVDRNQFPDNKYKFFIPPEEIRVGDTVKLWIFSPSWNGWSMSLHKVSARAKFVRGF